jgi:hypothetical protein
MPATRSQEVASEPSLILIRENGKLGYINSAGKVIIRPQYNKADEFYEGLARVQTGGKWGYIDATGKVVITPRFDCADNFSEGLARVIVGKKYGYVD